MHNILLVEKYAKGVSSSDFIEHILNISRQHRAENRAKAFAFIMADIKNANIQKVLNDEDYWKSLNAISGTNLTVFYIGFSKSSFRIEKKQVTQIRQQRRTKSLPPDAMEMMTLVQLENEEDANDFLKALMKDEQFYGEIPLPGILFFQTDGNDVLARNYIELNDDDSDVELFNTMKKYIKDVATNLGRIESRYSKNHNEIFRQVDEAIGGRKRNDILKKIPLRSMLNALIKFIG